MKINPEQLEKDIDSIPSICKEGKEAIKKLFTNNFDVEFPKVNEFDVSKLHLNIIGSRCTVKYGDVGGNNLITFRSNGTYFVHDYVDGAIPIQRNDSRGIKTTQF